MSFTRRQRQRNTKDGFAAFPCHEQRGLAGAQLFLNMSREWVWKEIFPFPELAKLQRPQLFQVQGPSVQLPTAALSPFIACPCSAVVQDPATGVREITRFNYRVSEMGEKKKSSLLFPPIPTPVVFCVWRSIRFYVTV